MFGLSSLATKIIAGLVLVVLVVGILYVSSCQDRRQQAAESRLQKGQTGALTESAKDAIATQGAAGEREQASEELTRSNEKEIRDAEGADAPVDPAVRDAGLDSLCRRAAYRNSERCRMRRAAPR